MSAIDNTELKASARYFDQIERASRLLARIEYPNINKLNTAFQLVKKQFDQVEQKSKLLASIQFTNIDVLNEKLKRTEKQLSNIKSMDKKFSSLALEVEVNVNNKITTVLENLVNKLGSLPNSTSSPSEKSPEEKAVITANYQKANEDVYNAKMNTKKVGYEVFKAPFDAIKAPFDLYNNIVKFRENIESSAKRVSEKVKTARSSKNEKADQGQATENITDVNKSKKPGRVKAPKDFGKPKTVVVKPIVKYYPKITVNCYCDGGGGGRGSKGGRKSGKGNKGSSRSSSNSKPKGKGFTSKVQGYSSEPKKIENSNKPKAVPSNASQPNNNRPTPPSSSTKIRGKFGGSSPHLGFAAGGAGLLGMGGSGLGGTPTMGDMASRLTDKIAGSKSGILKSVGKGLLGGGSRLFAPLAIATSIARVVKAKPEERSGAIGSAIGGTAGAALGGALGSVIPVFGTTLGAMAGGAIGSYVGGKLGETQIAKDALSTVSKGITGTFDYLADKTKNIKEGFMGLFSGPSKQPPPPPIQPQPVVNPAATLPAASIASMGAVNVLTASPAQIAAGKANKSGTGAGGALQQVQLDPAQMNTISGYLTNLKAQVTNSIAVHVPTGAVQVTVKENELDIDAIAMQVGQRIAGELRKSLQNRKPDSSGGGTSARPIMA